MNANRQPRSDPPRSPAVGRRRSGNHGSELPDLNTLLTFAIETAHQAGTLLRDQFDTGLAARYKDEIDLVTQADLDSEALILEAIQRTFPGHAVLAEESGTHGERSAPLWIVDPLDGTTNFAHGFPHFCVSIALHQENACTLGVIYDPLREETFWATAGQGAYLNDRPLRVTPVDRLVRSVIATGFSYGRAMVVHNNIAEFTRVMRRVQGIRRAGSAALDVAYVAAGRLDGYWEYYMQPWDIAAGALMVCEAGGLVTELDGGPWTPWSESTLAAGPALHPRLREALAGVAAG